jgi:excisionase family DNA binding protein
MQNTMTAAGNGHIIADWATLADYITADEAADISGYDVQHVRRLMRAQKIKGRKAGLVWLIERDSLQEYLAKVKALGTKKYIGIPQDCE